MAHLTPYEEKKLIQELKRLKEQVKVCEDKLTPDNNLQNAKQELFGFLSAIACLGLTEMDLLYGLTNMEDYL